MGEMRIMQYDKMKEKKIKSAAWHPGKKAFLFTLSFVLVTLAILSFANFVLKESGKERIIFQEYVLMNRLNDIDGSLQSSIKDIFATYSGIKASASNSTVIFEESIPGSPDRFESELSSLKNFAELNETSLKIIINESILKLPVSVMPQDIMYSHNFSRREIILDSVQSMNESVLKYKTTITFEENVTCSWDFYPGDFEYELEAISPKDSGCDHDRLISLSQNATITIISESDPDNRMTIYLSPSSFRIAMDNSSIFSAAVKSEIFLKNISESMWLSDDMIDINFERFGLRRRGGVRLG